MPFVEADEVAVDAKDWRLAQAGDEQAKQRIKQAITGLTLYSHILPVEPFETVVTLRELEAAGIHCAVKFMEGF